MADGRGLVGSVASALGDGAPIDWAAVSARAGSPREQALLQQLRTVSALERDATPAWPFSAAARDRPATTVAWSILLAIAAVEVVVALAAVALTGSIGATRLLPLQALLVAAFGAAALLLVARGDDRAVALGHCYLLIAATFARPLIASAGDDAAPIVRFLSHGPFTEAFLPLAFWRFARELPRTTRFSAADRRWPAVSALSGAIGLFLFVDTFAMSWLPGPPAVSGGEWLWAFRRSGSATAFWNTILALLLPALLTSAWRLRAAGGEERSRALWFLLAIVAGLTPVVGVGLAIAIVPGFDPSPDALVAAMLAGPASIPLTTAYAVLVHRVVSVRLVLRHGLRYVLARRVLSIALVVPALALLRRIYQGQQQQVGDLLSELGASTALWVMLGAAALMIVRAPLLALLDRRAHAATDHPNALARATAAIVRGRTVREAASELAAQIERTLGIARTVVMARLESGGFDTVHGFAPPLPAGTALHHLLDGMPVLQASPDDGLFRLLPEPDREWLLRARVAAIAGITLPARGLVGIVALAGRPTGTPFDAAELSFIEALATTASVAFTRPAPDEEQVGAVECPACGLVSVAVRCGCGATLEAAKLPPVLSGKFEVIRRLGRGGMGVVYLAKDRGLDRHVALKTLPATTTAAAAGMLAEARTMAVVDHPNVAVIHGLEIWRHTPVLVVEHLALGTLNHRLLRGALAPGEALLTGALLANGLGALHDAGILHRDIKPSNVGFTRSGVPKLLDFGVARLLVHSDLGLRMPAAPAEETTGQLWLQTSTAVAGTPRYLPPEAFTGAPPDRSFDLWGLSLVVLEAILGRYSLPAAARQLPPPLAALFARTLHVDARERPASAAALAAEFRKAAARVGEQAAQSHIPSHEVEHT